MDEKDPWAAAAALMAAQGGVITRSQARSVGLTPSQIDTRLRREEWFVVRRGTYAATAPDDDDAGAAHALAVAARACGRKQVHAGSHRSAALVLGIPLLGLPPRHAQLVRAPTGPGDVSTEKGVHVARLDPDEAVLCRGVLVTSPARTVVDVARTSPFRDGVVATDAVLHAGLPRRELEAMLARCARWPGAVAAARAVAFADERAESVLESLDRVAFAECGLPAPRTQVDVVTASGLWLGRVDFLFEEQRTVVEPDGLAKYRLRAGDTVPQWAETALAKEKQRELGLQRHGLQVVRNEWDEAFRRPRELAERVRRHLAVGAALPRDELFFLEQDVRRKPLRWPLA
ncbi:MAG: type IV toxin-antitoxin system AbiEi family antitoxin domain-containing protein [Actinomycetes bacterium]